MSISGGHVRIDEGFSMSRLVEPGISSGKTVVFGLSGNEIRTGSLPIGDVGSPNGVAEVEVEVSGRGRSGAASSQHLAEPCQ
ncbi:MAG: hypothetical protein WCD69_02285 [Xanthobacteraceae bacterium]